MADTIYMVQWNLGGFTGPKKMYWREAHKAYWSKCGNYSYAPQGRKRGGIQQVAFDNKKDADIFVDGCKFTAEWFRKRMNIK